MEGVTTALVLFVIAGVLFPRLIDNRPQYYVGFVCVLLIILLGGLMGLIRDSGFNRFAVLGIAILQIVGFVMLFLSAGGLTVRGLTKEMASAFEVIRRGETQKEVIIPIGDKSQKPSKRQAAEEAPRERVDLSDEGSYPKKAPSPPSAPKKDDGPLPMD